MSDTNRIIGYGFFIVAIAIFIAIFSVSFIILYEAFGPGPPYYGQTANMDKWENPIPAIVVIDFFGLIVAGVLFWAGSRKLRTKQRTPSNNDAQSGTAALRHCGTAAPQH